MKPMNKSKNESNYRNRRHHSSSFSSVYPPGGLVAWPDGRTTRIGERRMSHALASGTHKERKGFVAWPAKTGNQAQA